MKHRIWRAALAALILFTSATAAVAQTADDINFVSSVPEGKALTSELAKQLKLKVDQMIAANNAGAVSVSNAFVIEAAVTVGETYTSATGVRPVTLQRGELSLVAKNRIDGSIYNSTTLKLESNVVGKGSAATEALVRSIKPTDKAIVRFIRNSRTRIAEFYEQNGLELPVYVEDSKDSDKDKEEIDGGEITVFEFPGTTPATTPATTPDTPANPDGQPSAAAAPVANQGVTLEYEKDSWYIEVGWCRGYTSSNSVRFELKITNKLKNTRRCDISVENGYMPNGAEIKRWDLVNWDGYSTDRWNVNFPSDIFIGRVIQLSPVGQQIDKFPLIEMKIGGMILKIKNLPIEWM